jgi:hypothetical protein
MATCRASAAHIAPSGGVRMGVETVLLIVILTFAVGYLLSRWDTRRDFQGRQVEEGTGQTLEVKPGLSCGQWQYHHSLPERLHYLWSLGGGKK